EVGRRAAEQVGQHDDAAALVDGANRIGDLLAPHLHIVVGADADSRDRALRADDMLHRGHHFLGESPMGDENHSEQRQCFIAGHAVDYPQEFPPGAGEAGGGLPSSPSCGAESRLRWLTVGAWPASRRVRATRSAQWTERWRPPVQPKAMVT